LKNSKKERDLFYGVDENNNKKNFVSEEPRRQHSQ